MIDLKNNLKNLGFNNNFIELSLKDEINSNQISSGFITKPDSYSSLISKETIDNSEYFKNIKLKNNYSSINKFGLSNINSFKDFEDLYKIDYFNILSEETNCLNNNLINNYKIGDNDKTYDKYIYYKNSNINNKPNLNNVNNKLIKKNKIHSNEYIENNINIISNVLCEINKNINKDKIFVKAYSSKLKLKNLNIYINNTKQTEKANELKRYHQCNYPDCKRTFSSSGWLKSHLNEHMDDIYQDIFNKEFDKHIKASKTRNKI